MPRALPRLPRPLLAALSLSLTLGTAQADTAPLFSADGYRITLYRSPTPAQVDGAQVVDTATLQRLLSQLRTGGYTYTLDPGVYAGQAADQFWFDHKEGFCEHISAAFVIALRSAGVPARIVTGYQGGEMNGVDGYWTVRQADAHAWAEVWLGTQEGWVRVDPTGAVSPGRIGASQRLNTSNFMGVSVNSPAAISSWRIAIDNAK